VPSPSFKRLILSSSSAAARERKQIGECGARKTYAERDRDRRCVVPRGWSY